MPRRARPTDRPKVPDRKYANLTIQQFINKVMRDGKRSTAEGIVYDAVDRAEQATRKPAVRVLNDEPDALPFLVSRSGAGPIAVIESPRVG